MSGKSEYTLTPHQQAACDRTLELLADHDVVLVKGCAGVGKTVLLSALVGRLSEKWRVACAAPTNKAESVLRDKVGSSSRMITTGTIHRMLRIRGRVNAETGEMEFCPPYVKGSIPLDGIRYFVVDEVSMVSGDLLRHLMDAAKDSQVKVILCGDPRQLNPVGERSSPAFSQGYPEVELTEIIRQEAGNPIVQLSRSFREELPNLRGHLVDGRGYAFTSNWEAVAGKLMESNGSSRLRYIAWTNSVVNRVNSRVRELIYGDPKDVEVGETLILGKPYMRGSFKLYTNEEILVERVRSAEAEFKNPKGEKCQLSVDVVNSGILTVRRESLGSYRKLVRQWREACLDGKRKWSDFYSLLEQFASFKYVHAITAHKSQGSTYDSVVVDLRDMMRNPNVEERDRMLYTAITRARNVVIFYVGNHEQHEQGIGG